MEASKARQISYIPYVMAICSLLSGMFVKDLLLHSWDLFYSPYTTPIQESISLPCNKQPTATLEQLTALFAQGDELFHDDKIEDAIKKYKEILNKDHTTVMCFMRLATALCKIHKYEQAEYFYRVAIALQPTFVPAYVKLAIVQQKLNKLDSALNTLIAAIVLQPDNFDAIFSLSKVYCDLSQFNKGIELAKKAIDMQPDNVHTHLNLGHIYNKQGDTQAACQQYQKAIAVEPTLANAHYNLGYTLRVQQEPQKALPHLYKALELQPDYPDAHIALAQAYWTFGDFKTAWIHYQWRWKQLGVDPKALDIPLWDGSPLNGKKILIYCEQGLGDTLQFIRYLKIIKEQYGGYIILKTQKALAQFVALCPYIDEVITSASTHVSEPSVQAPLLNMPGILETTVQTIPHSIPYLYTDKELDTHWKKILSKDTNIKVGLCWSVLPAHEISKSPLSLRSVSLMLFAPLAEIPGISFYSLQKMDGLEQILELPEYFKVHTFGKDFDESHGSFMDSASIIKNLDVVISVDTVIAHLAGGLGKPVWTLLPFSPDCRWDHDFNTTPWYKNMRLFRQSAWKDWESVIARIKQELDLFVKQHKRKR